MIISMSVQKKMFADVDFSEFDKKNDKQVFVNVKRFLMFDFLFETDNERLSKKAHDSDSNVFVTAFASD